MISVLRGLGWSFTFILGAISVWWGFRAVTGPGRTLAAAGLLLASLPLPHLLRVQNADRRWWRWYPAISLMMVTGILAALLLNAPSGRPAAASPVLHRFTREVSYPVLSPTNIIPEAEQISLGFAGMPWVDPLLDQNQARRVWSFTQDIYREMEADPNFRELGSVLGWAYADLAGRRFDVGHYYLYLPQRPASGPRPLLIFLHGAAGNFKAYTWVFSPLVEEHNLVLIAPSFGFGNWRKTGGTAAIQRALDDVMQVTEIDPDQVYLMGLSNGGLGVSLAAAEWPELFRGLIFLSPAMATEAVEQQTFLDSWRGRPVLVVSGEDDRRVPVAYVRSRVAALQQSGVAVSEEIYPGEDHFLVFSQPASVLQDISDWLSGID